MRSFLRILGGGKRRRKERRMGEPLEAPALEGLGLSARVEVIRDLVSLQIGEIYRELDREVGALAGPRYGRKGRAKGPGRHGFNPGSVRLGGQRVPVWVPRVRGEKGEIALRSYQAFQEEEGEVSDRLLRQVLYGISCRDYEGAARKVPGALGLSKSSVSRVFVEETAQRLKEFQERDLSKEDYLVLFLDGKSFAEDELIVALGATVEGPKHFLGFTEAASESSEVVGPFLEGLVDRGLDVSRGILVVMDGSKGFCKAVRKVFKGKALVQRCQWHKRENVVKALPKSEQDLWRKKLQKAYERPTLEEAAGEFKKLHAELGEKNLSAQASLEEGLEETLTLHRLGVFPLLGRSLKTSNCIESILSQVERRCGKVSRWTNSEQKHRWLAATLLDTEPRLRRIHGYAHLPKLREAIQRELGITAESEEKVSKQAA